MYSGPAAAKSLQSCPTLCDPRHGSPPGSLVPGILQARTLEWIAIFFSNAWMWKVKMKSLSRVRLLATPWTAAYHAPPSMGFSRQEYWSWLPLPSPTLGLLLTNCIIRDLTTWAYVYFNVQRDNTYLRGLSIHSLKKFLYKFTHTVSPVC